VLVERWQTEQFPQIRAEAKKVQAQIFFADESGVRSDYHAGTTWAPRGATPVVKATGARFGLNMLSAVSARGEFRFMLHEGTVNAQVFREFLRRLMIGQSTPVFLIVDGHPAHRARLVREFVEQQGGRLKLWFLPPYSPELNPDELVWGHVKQAVAKKVPQTKAQLKQRVRGGAAQIAETPRPGGFVLPPSDLPVCELTLLSKRLVAFAHRLESSMTVPHRLVAGWWVSGAGEMAAQASCEADGIAEQVGSFDAFFLPTPATPRSRARRTAPAQEARGSADRAASAA
jgi:transposase